MDFLTNTKDIRLHLFLNMCQHALDPGVQLLGELFFYNFSIPGTVQIKPRIVRDHPD